MKTIEQLYRAATSEFLHLIANGNRGCIFMLLLGPAYNKYDGDLLRIDDEHQAQVVVMDWMEPNEAIPAMQSLRIQ